MNNFNLFFKKSFISFLSLAILLASFPVSILAQTGGLQNANTSSDDAFNQQGTADTQPLQRTGFSDTLITDDAQKSSVKSDQAIQGAGFNTSLSNPGATTGSGSGASSVGEKKELYGKILPTQPEESGAESNAAADAISCAVGDILANGISGIVTKAIDTLFDSILGTTKKEVPTEPVVHVDKEVGTLVVWGIPILPSWDAIAYCLANVIITYVADSTIAWIQSGFEGNPVFVDDPTKLFQDLADYEMNNFLETLEDGLLCDNFSSSVKSALVNNYTSDYQSSSKCALGALEEEVTGLVNGTANYFSYEAWFALTQNPNNNAAGSYIKSYNESQRLIQARQNSVSKDLDRNDGWYSWVQKDGVNKGKVVSPGKTVQTVFEQRLNLAPGRLVLAEKFDQVISTLVNYLIKVAITEGLGAAKGALDGAN